MKATIYDPKNGKILRSVSAGKLEDLEANLGDDDSWVEGDYDPNEYYIEGSMPKALPEAPSFPCYFDYESKSWVWDEAKSWRVLRAERNRLLAESDWTQASDAPVDHAAWADYRKKLRDLPSNTADPRNPTWPEKPL